MRLAGRVIGGAFLLALVATGCGGDQDHDRARVEALTARVQQLEQRLGAAEKAAEPLPQVRDQVASLDRRVSTIETGLHQLAAAAPAPAAPPPHALPDAAAAVPPTRANGGPIGRPTLADRQDRRAQLRELSTEFRARLAALRTPPGEAPSPEQQQQVQDVLQWYRDQRRAVMTGQGRTDH